MDGESMESFIDALEEAYCRRERENQGSEVFLNVYDMVRTGTVIVSQLYRVIAGHT